MHFESPPESRALPESDGGPWFRGLTGYQWFVFAVAALAWLFDTMDQQLFNLARNPAVTQLLRDSPLDRELRVQIESDLKREDPRGTPAEYEREVTTRHSKALANKVSEFGGYATSIFMIGWALGGMGFGILGDRIGRVKTLMLTILLYSAFTGLSALSLGVKTFSLYRFLTGLGVGGVFAVAVSLVAEVMPDRVRPRALGMLQALSAVGNMMAAGISIGLGWLEQYHPEIVGSSWRSMFLIGMAPALLVIPIFRRLKEPERWKAAAAQEEVADGAGEAQAPKHKLGSLSELFGDPRWRRNTLVGMALAFAGVVGLWGIGFFSFDLARSIFQKEFQAQNLPPKEIAGRLTRLAGYISLLQNFGAFFGIYAFSRITHYTGRKPAFAVSFLLAMASTAYTFWFFNDPSDILWMIPIMGFCQLALFGGYAIYFPELFPTRLRSTGTSFCYNVGRLVAAAGPAALGFLSGQVFGGTAEPMRYAGLSMCSVFIIGLLALPFAPETQGKPLPE